jgi:hypothetical protein
MAEAIGKTRLPVRRQPLAIGYTRMNDSHTLRLAAAEYLRLSNETLDSHYRDYCLDIARALDTALRRLGETQDPPED